MVDLHKNGGYNQGYLVTIKMNNKYIINNGNKNMNMKDKSVRL